MATKNIDPNSIIIEPGTYPRSKEPDEKAVQHLIGVATPPIVTANGGVSLVDGAHRRLAAIINGETTVKVEDLGPMTPEAILLEAIQRNATHGKQLTPGEKQKLAKTLLGTTKQKDIATLFAVSERTVTRWVEEVKDLAKVRATTAMIKELEKPEHDSVNAIAKRIGEKYNVAPNTLKGWVKAADGEPPAPKPKKKDSKPAKAGSEALSDEVLDACADAATDCFNRVKSIAKDFGVSKEDVAYQISVIVMDRC